jgi:hypothetical protein
MQTTTAAIDSSMTMQTNTLKVERPDDRQQAVHESTDAL